MDFADIGFLGARREPGRLFLLGLASPINPQTAEEHGDQVPGEGGVGRFTRVQQHQSRAFVGSKTCADRINPGGHAHPFYSRVTTRIQGL